MKKTDDITLPATIGEFLARFTAHVNVARKGDLADAEQLERWADEATEHGARLLVEGNGVVREVVLR